LKPKREIKMFKKTISLILISVLILSFVACGAGNEKKIIGTWSAKMDFTDIIMSEYGDEFVGFDSKLEMIMLFEFKSNGTYEMSLYKNDADIILKKWIEDVISFVKKTMVEEAASIEMTYEEFEAAFEEENGVPFENELRNRIDSEINMYNIINEIENTGKYKIKGDKLFTIENGSDFDNSNYEIIEIVDDRLELISTTDPDYDKNNALFQYPFTMTKLKK